MLESEAEDVFDEFGEVSTVMLVCWTAETDDCSTPVERLAKSIPFEECNRLFTVDFFNVENGDEDVLVILLFDCRCIN
jgi:hypothetical protein